MSAPTLTVAEAKATLDAAGFWCAFHDRKRRLRVYYQPAQGEAKQVASFHGHAEQCDIDRLKAWRANQESGVSA